MHRPRQDAEAALKFIRETFRTFCFADAVTVIDEETGLELVDVNARLGRTRPRFWLR